MNMSIIIIQNENCLMYFSKNFYCNPCFAIMSFKCDYIDFKALLKKFSRVLYEIALRRLVQLHFRFQLYPKAVI